MFSFTGAARVILKALPGSRALRTLFVRDKDGTVAYLDEVQAAVSAAAAADALTVHRAGVETITGLKTFTALMNEDARLYWPQTVANDSLRFRRLENLAGFHNNTSNAVGTLVIRLPNTSPNTFFGLRFRLWEYIGRGITTVEACGYIRSTIAFDNTGASSTDVVRVRYVRFARDPSGYWCVLLSNNATHTSSTWSYPQGLLESIHLGWSGSSDAAWSDPTQYTVSLITDETGYTISATADMQGQVGAATGYNDALNAYMLNGITAAGFAPAAHVGAGAAAHAAATTSVDGFMAAADKTKLDALPTTGAAFTLRGNNTAGVATLADLTVAQIKTMLAYTPADIGAATSAHTHAAATTSVDGFLSAADKTKLDGLANYTLPAATAGTLGGVKVGSGLTIDGSGVLSASGGSGSSPLVWSHGITNPTVGTTRTAMFQGGHGSRVLTGVTYGTVFRSRIVADVSGASAGTWTLELELGGVALFAPRTGLPLPAVNAFVMEIECETQCYYMTTGDVSTYLRTNVKITITPNTYGNSQSLNLFISADGIGLPTAGAYEMYGTVTSGTNMNIQVKAASVYKFR